MDKVQKESGPTIIPPVNQENIKLGHESEPFNLRHHEEKAEAKLDKPKREISLAAILLSGFIVVVTVLAIGAIFYAKNQTKVEMITDFESCAAAGNPIMESYPEQCSANGQTFTRVLTEEEQKKLNSTSNSPELPTGWETFTNETNEYSLGHPKLLVPDCSNSYSCSFNSENDDSGYYIRLIAITKSPSFDTTAINTIKKQLNLAVGEEIIVPHDRNPIEFQRVRNEDLNSNGQEIKTFTYFENGIPVQKAYFIEKDNNIYMIHFIFDPGTSTDVFDQIASTFRFTDNDVIDSGTIKLIFGPTNIYMQLPENAGVINNSGSSLVTLDNAEFEIKTTAGSGVNCGETCKTNDEVFNSTNPLLKIDPLRIWTENGQVFMINPQSIYLGDKFLVDGLTIRKTKPNTTFTNSEVSEFKKILNTISTD